jgi:hypothetical protein
MPGWAEVSIFVYVGNDESFDPKECKGCTIRTSDNSMAIVSSYFELNCDCETKPTPSPTPAPTSEPTPHTEVCSEQMMAAATITAEGGATDVEWPDNAVEIVAAYFGSVNLSLSQLWDIDASLTMLSVHYHDQDAMSICNENFDVVPYAELLYWVLCLEGYAELNIFAYVGDSDGFDPDTCGNCNAPQDDNSNLIAYYVELPCEIECEPTAASPTTVPPSPSPTPEPTPSPTAETEEPTPSPTPEQCPSDKWELDCPNDVVLLSQIGGTNYSQFPIEIIEQNGQSVTFAIHQVWADSISHVYTQYHETEATVVVWGCQLL